MSAVLEQCSSKTLNEHYADIDAFARGKYSADDLFASKGVRIKEIGKGSSKVVYDLFDGYVLKVHLTRSRYGNQVKTECLNWQNATPSRRVILAPIVAHADDYWWSIQPLATRVGEQPYYVTEEFRSVDLDSGLGNVGMLNGVWVLIDYGYEPHHISID